MILPSRLARRRPDPSRVSELLTDGQIVDVLDRPSVDQIGMRLGGRR
ncbi:hypothetical protein GCM10022419_099580 [Nonomuraea rosea]|uniref:Uncharacterized protein n=1 Tax=Nonomuraea rosea TaxID=638574 RepID=A0ABP6Z6U2_9ACTN